MINRTYNSIFWKKSHAKNITVLKKYGSLKSTDFEKVTCPRSSSRILFVAN